MATKKPVRRKKVAPASAGLSPAETLGSRSPDVDRLANHVETDGGAVLGSYLDPVGGRGLLLAALPIDKVDPTPYQRDPSEAHVKRLMTVIEKVGRFLDPIIAIRHDDRYWTPNGNHRLQALRRLGIKTVISLVVPEAEVAFKILALNTEKAHNLREKSLETIRMARALAESSNMNEAAYAFEFEQAPFLTLGICYEHRPRMSGGAYQSLLKRIDEFVERPLSQALKERERRAARILEVDDRVADIVERLKRKGLTSPYLRAFVVARINPIRFSKATSFDFNEVMDKMKAAAAKFNVDKIRQEDVARAAGGPPDDES
ncbi:MAG: ParB N-terminal domain-containing protein [Acidobacteria bacterium]|nr:ParB N-terminal domain-containing protein [Acidobacteriota bacterium]